MLPNPADAAQYCKSCPIMQYPVLPFPPPHHHFRPWMGEIRTNEITADLELKGIWPCKNSRALTQFCELEKHSVSNRTISAKENMYRTRSHFTWLLLLNLARSLHMFHAFATWRCMPAKIGQQYSPRWQWESRPHTCGCAVAADHLFLHTCDIVPIRNNAQGNEDRTYQSRPHFMQRYVEGQFVSVVRYITWEYHVLKEYRLFIVPKSFATYDMLRVNLCQRRAYSHLEYHVPASPSFRILCNLSPSADWFMSQLRVPWKWWVTEQEVRWVRERDDSVGSWCDGGSRESWGGDWTK